MNEQNKVHQRLIRNTEICADAGKVVNEVIRSIGGVPAFSDLQTGRLAMMARAECVIAAVRLYNAGRTLRKENK